MLKDVDPHLAGMLRAAMALADALKDLGTSELATVRLTREDGLRLLELVAGARHRDAEAWSQLGRPARPGFSNLRIAGLIFEWPAEGLAGQVVANDNLRTVGRGLDFGEDAPARR